MQFLPAANPLVREALEQAVEKEVTNISARVFTAEHLAAIALQTGRAKDKARVRSSDLLDQLTDRHRLCYPYRRYSPGLQLRPAAKLTQLLL